MRILSVEIHNIASVRDAFIDFESGALGEASLFLICGPTGSGKTTILDAISLALFGQTPRLAGRTQEAYRSDDVKDSISIADQRQLMSRGTGECHAAVRFEAVDGHVYKASWSVRRSRNKPGEKLQNAQRSLVSDDGTRTWTKKEMPAQMLELTGLTFEQFCRTTLLAQGEFTRFLKSKGDEKAEILEKLTRTGEYSLIGKRIYSMAQEKNAEIEALRAETAAIKVLAEEEAAAIAESARQTAAVYGRLHEEEELLRANASWLRNFHTRLAERESNRQSIGQLQAILGSAEFRTKEKTVEEYVRSEKARNAIQEQKRLTVQLDHLRIRRKNTVEGLDTAQKKMPSVIERQTALTQETERLRDALSSLRPEESHKADKALAQEESDAAAAAKALLPLETLFAKSAETEGRINGLAEELAKLERRLANDREQLPALRERYEEARDIYDRTSLGMSDHARALRASLHEGDICPVCSRRIERLVSEPHLKAILAPLLEKKEQARKTLEAFSMSEKATAAEIRRAAKERTDMETRLRQEHKALAEAREAAAKAFRKAGIELDSCSADAIAAASDAIEARLRSIGMRRESLRKNLEKAAMLNSQILKAQQALALVMKEQAECEGETAKLRSILETCDADERQITAQMAECTRLKEEFINSDGRMDENRLAHLATLDAAAIREADRFCRQQREQAAALDGAARNIAEALEELERTMPEAYRPLAAAGKQLPEAAPIEAEAAGKRQEMAEAAKSLGKAEAMLKTDAENRRLVETRRRQMSELEGKASRWRTLARLLGDREGKTFRNVAQSYVLTHLLDIANVYMRRLTERYTLTCVPGELVILVEDSANPGRPQSVNCLSGGESFIASLALALALSGLRSSAFGIDMLFIDEGFGSLSADCLESVLETLQRLHEIGGKKVGIISHVEMLRERIPARIEVRRINPVESEIKVRAEG